MNRRTTLIIVTILVIAVLAILTATLIFSPGQTSPAFQTAIDFVNAAATGDETAARARVSQSILDYTAANCPDGQLSACVHSYTPPEWGEFKSGVFRRAAPDGESWDVDVIAYYTAGTGASGVCVYARVEPISGDSNGEAWQITRFAGFVHCGDPASRDMASNPDAPNSVP